MDVTVDSVADCPFRSFRDGGMPCEHPAAAAGAVCTDSVADCPFRSFRDGGVPCEHPAAAAGAVCTDLDCDYPPMDCPLFGGVLLVQAGLSAIRHRAEVMAASDGKSDTETPCPSPK